ncbi:MAG: signal peptidase II [Bacilli bacterium]|nr:signal peptidase II [Bacilli bacterium]
MKKKAIIILISILIIDLIIKYFVVNNFMLYESKTIINNFFRITYVQNNGAAFSILAGNRFFFITIAITSIIMIYYLFIKGKVLNNLEVAVYSLLIGGIICNLLDRIIYGYVIDYFDFNIFGYNFPVFNFGDICITIATFMLIIIIYKGESHERI